MVDSERTKAASKWILLEPFLPLSPYSNSFIPFETTIILGAKLNLVWARRRDSYIVLCPRLGYVGLPVRRVARVRAAVAIAVKHCVFYNLSQLEKDEFRRKKRSLQF